MQMHMDESTKDRIALCGTMINIDGTCIVEELYRQTPNDKSADALFAIFNRVMCSLI